MKLFLSWSGELSHKVACVFRDWIPSVLQSVTPYVSSEDIDKGARWSTDIAKELELSAHGILFITHENVEAPWLNFEAGALSKTVEKSRVSPFLFNVKRSDIQGPLLQFQSTILEKDDVEKLVSSINKSCPETERLEEVRLKKVFDVWWPQLEEALNSITTEVVPSKTSPSSTKRTSTSSHHVDSILEELLDLVRTQHKILRSPEELLPPGYISYLFKEQIGGEPKIDEETLYVMAHRIDAIKSFLSLLQEKPDDSEIMAEVVKSVSSLDDLVKHMLRDFARALIVPARTSKRTKFPGIKPF